MKPPTAGRRVAMLLSSPPGPLSGGPGTFVAGVLEALNRSGRFEVTLLAPARHAGGPGRRASQARLVWWQMLQLLRARPDVIHVHEHPSLIAAAVAYKLLWRRSTRIVFTSHIDPVERRAWWKRAIVGGLLSHCACVTVMAQQSIAKIAFVATPSPRAERVTVVPAAASVRIRDKSDPEVRAFATSLGCHNGPVILQISNCVYPAKVAGTLRLLEAFVDIQRRRRDAHLLLIGRGPLVSTVIEARDQLGLTSSVAIPVTFIDDLSLPLALADVHCHISLQDMCPISVLEAMHAGKPLVASRAGGIPELVEDGVTGVLVDDDPYAIAAAVVDLLEHPAKAAALGSAAQRLARTRFTWDRVAADCEQLYEPAPHAAATPSRAQAFHVAN